MEGYIAQIIMFGGNWAPRNWALCQGQLLPIQQYTALFSIIGTIYGGDGRNTFGLPDLRGRVAMGQGSGPGLSPRSIGQKFGSENNTLTVQQMPSHNHTARLRAESAAGNTGNPNGNLLGVVTGGANPYVPPAPPEEVDMSSDAIIVNNNGGNQPINNIQPVQVMNYVICLQGIFPSRN